MEYVNMKNKDKECLEILYTVLIGASRTEKEAIEHIEKRFKQAKKYRKFKKTVLTNGN